jgi:adenosine deaminase
MSVRTLLQDLPKVQLHCHLEGTVSPATFLALACKHGVDIGTRAKMPQERMYAFSGFIEFLMLFKSVSETLCTPADFARIAREYVVDAAEQRIRYAELFISPSVWTYFQPALDTRATVMAIREALDEEGARRNLEAALIVDLTRNFGPEAAMRTAELAVSLREYGVIGVGLGGDEARFPAKIFAESFTYARDQGLHCVAHAGEAAGAQSVREAIDLLKAERIGHGVRALEDLALVDELAARQIPLEICLTSNRLTGVIPPGQPHPLRALDERGVLCTIDVDDPAIFNTTITREYLHVAELLGTEAPLRMARAAIDACFASEEKKAALRGELEAALSCRT